MNSKLFILSSFFFLVTFCVQAQNTSEKTLIKTDTIAKSKAERTEITDSLRQLAYRPNPMKVVWMGAIIPGYGQILNHKLWKLPIVYGGFMGCIYAISWNNNKYESFKNAYRDIIDSDPNTNSFLNLIPKGYTIDTYGGISGYTSILKSAQDNYRRYRDLSIIVSVGFYALTLVDAYVDAQLYDFDISPDLSLRFQPTLIDAGSGFSNTLGMQCSIRLK